MVRYTLNLSRPLRGVSLVRATESGRTQPFVPSEEPSLNRRPGTVRIGPPEPKLPEPTPPPEPKPAPQPEIDIDAILAEQEKKLRAAHVQQLEELHRILLAMDQQVNAILQRHRESVSEMRQAAVEIGVAVASRVVHNRIQATEHGIADLVDGIIHEFDTAEAITIRLHPEDVVLLGRSRATAVSDSVRILADASVRRGDCHAEGPRFDILADTETSLAEIRQHLLECVEHA